MALAAPAVLGTATPAFASGESTSAVLTSPASGSASTFTWTYAFNQGAGHGLSNIAIGFCSADILADVVSAGPSGGIFTDQVPGGHSGFGPGVKFDTTNVTGTLTVTFAHPHAISAGGLQIQSHSGDGRTGDTITTAAGPGGCPSDAVVPPVVTPPVVTPPVVTPPGDDETGGNAGSDGTPNSDDPPPQVIIHSDPAPTVTRDPAPTVTTDPTTTTTTGDPAPAANPPAEDTTVLGATLEKPALPTTGSPVDDPAVAPAVQSNLAHTGSDHLMLLVRLGEGLLLAGVLALAAGFRRRRNRSVSSAG
ncbi:MAG TPA: hypothetical protein VGP90_06605 [Acidimicrobiia bacterium]|nr:hypothetical protein [Acidimicrobiia bacterium]